MHLSYVYKKHPHHKTKLKKFQISRKDRHNTNNASGGIAVLIDNSKYTEQITINTNIEAIAVKIFTPIQLTILMLGIFTTQPRNKSESLSKLYITNFKSSPHNEHF